MDYYFANHPGACTLKMSQPQLSTEEGIRGLSTHDMTIQELIASCPVSIVSGHGLPSNNTCVPCDGVDFIDPQNCDIGKNELDMYLPKFGNLPGSPLDSANRLANDIHSWPPFGHDERANKQLSAPSTHVSLSSSTGVPHLKRKSEVSRSIQIVNDLESDYKPRYKSDYFSQNGIIRFPRYVTDRFGKHSISIRVTPGLKGYIRIDWVTAEIGQHVRFAMPYKFQVNNQSPNVPDENPTYKPVEADGLGLMEILLVLIKSKQGELREAQPLQLFPPPLQRLIRNPLEKGHSLSPKQLIETYQLDKSQLAFTYCELGPDGRTCVPDWSTTVFSSVMTEKPDDTSKKRKVTCPSCSCSFEVSNNRGDDVDNGTVFKKR